MLAEICRPHYKDPRGKNVSCVTQKELNAMQHYTIKLKLNVYEEHNT
jgi:hypothetical protein